MADMHGATQPQKRKRIRSVVITLLVATGLMLAGLAIIGEQYRGPRTLDAVTMAMPGVPLFPFATIAPSNRAAQRLLAVPLLLMRLQGVREVEAVMLQAPADREFVLDWYRRAAPFQNWIKLQEAPLSGGTRLIYARNREVLQVIIGRTRGGMVTPVELIYLNGVSDTQISRLQAQSGASR